MAKQSKLIIKTTPFLFGGEKIEVKGKEYYIKYKGMDYEKAECIIKNTLPDLKPGASLTSKSK